jgi:hypothetical protein
VGVPVQIASANYWNVLRYTTYSENNGADIVVEASCSDSLLMCLWCTSLLGQDESGTDPDSGSTEHKGSSQTLSIEQTTGSNDLHVLAGQGALLSSAKGGNSWDQDGSWDITSVATTLTTLRADDIGSDLEALLDVLGVSDHVHVEDASLVDAVDDVLGGNTDGGDEELSA